MTWKIADGTRWVQDDAGTLTGDPDTLAGMEEYAGLPVELATMAGVYEPTGSDDPVGRYLLARQLLPGGTVTGDEPAVPAAEYDPDVVY